jgi:hypothetical protein
MLASQAPQPIYRAAVAEQQRRLLPTVIPSSSSAYPRRFSSMQVLKTRALLSPLADFAVDCRTRLFIIAEMYLCFI